MLRMCDECAGAAEACPKQTEEDEDQSLLVRLSLVSLSQLPVLHVALLCMKAQKLEQINERASILCTTRKQGPNQHVQINTNMLKMAESRCLDQLESIDLGPVW